MGKRGKSDLKTRIDTLKTLVEGSQLWDRPNTNRKGEILIEEIDEVYKVYTKVRNSKRRHLLMIFHSSRVLDTSLKTYLAINLIRKTGNSIGAYLKGLKDNETITQKEREKYQKLLVDERNSYMHAAGKYPKDIKEVNIFIVELQHLLVKVLHK